MPRRGLKRNYQEMVLHKVLTSDRNLIVKATYAEDIPLITKFHKSAGLGLEACVKDTLDSIQSNSLFYKVELENGPLVGWFAVAPDQTDEDGNPIKVMEGFYIRINCRTPEIKSAFMDLINETFSNDFYTSTGSHNYKAISFLLKNNFQIVNPSFDYNGKNLVILKTSK
jgi:hypothetical protein